MNSTGTAPKVQEAKCPKCGWNAFRVFFRDTAGSGLPPGEVLVFECSRCGLKSKTRDEITEVRKEAEATRVKVDV